MEVAKELYAALSPYVPEGRLFDTKFPDTFVLADTAVVFSEISDVPEKAIDGTILRRDQRWQVSIYSVDLPTARALRRSVITALDNLSSGEIALCEFESAPGVIVDNGVPPSYHIPIDFSIEL